MARRESRSADKVCPKCRSTRINCDRTLPGCRKCVSRGFRCPRYGLILRWNQGVASRGPLAGNQVPVRNLIVGDASLEQDIPRLSEQVQRTVSEQCLVSIPRVPNVQIDSMTLELMHHFNQNISTKLAWVDVPNNPWRQIIIPLAWASRAVLHAQDHPRRQNLQGISLHLWNQALISLPEQISRMRQEGSLAGLEPNQAQFALASTLELYNVELLGADSVKWRKHLQAARVILRTVFNPLCEPEQDIQHAENNAVFSNFVNIINRITRIERLKHNQGYELNPTLLEDITQKLDEAKNRMLQFDQKFQFQTVDARISFLHLIYAFHDASLIYIHYVLANDSSKGAYLHALRDSILDPLGFLSDRRTFTHDLVWPLFIAGTECRGFPEKQEIVVREIEIVMAISGSLDRRKVFSFLRQFWLLGLNSSMTWIQLMREHTTNHRILIL
ncbi:unnamed protein product [Penicillium nalgiovense]|nr:unnamed protein product [Penicillium nalgiovense]